MQEWKNLQWLTFCSRQSLDVLRQSFLPRTRKLLSTNYIFNTGHCVSPGSFFKGVTAGKVLWWFHSDLQSWLWRVVTCETSLHMQSYKCLQCHKDLLFPHIVSIFRKLLGKVKRASGCLDCLQITSSSIQELGKQLVWKRLHFPKIHQ